MLEHSSTARPVRLRTEEFRYKQNLSILPTDGHPPFHPSTSNHPPNLPTQPSQPSLPPPTLSLSRPKQPTWPETTHLLPPAPPSQPEISRPEQSTPLPLTMSPSFVQGSSASGHRESRSPSSSRKPIQSAQDKKSRRIGRYHCDHLGCSSTSSTAKSLRRHELLHQAPNPKAKCGRCGKQMSRMDSVLRHERICKEQGLPEPVESPESEEEDSP